MKLGNFSVSLAVKDVKVSFEFYNKLGFEQIGGDINQGWCIIRNHMCVLGLFQNILDANSLTFNPKWNDKCELVSDIADIRDIYKSVKDDQVNITGEISAGSEGPAHFSIEDPDGNVILFDQHV